MRERVRRTVWLLAAAAAICSGVAAREGPSLEPLDPALAERVKASIDVGLNVLRFEQRDDGSWADDFRLTALALRALTESHRRYNEEDGPFVRRAVDYLVSAFDQPEPGRSELVTADLALLSLALRGSARDAARSRAEVAATRLVEGLESARELDAWSAALALQALRAAAVSEKHPASIAAAAALSVPLQCGKWERSRSFHDAYTCAHALHAGSEARVGDAEDGVRRRRSEIAEDLLSRQTAEGYWLAEAGGEWPIATAVALLALERLYAD